MRIRNSRYYEEVPFDITPLDLAILYDSYNIGVQRQSKIAEDIWDNYKWILPKKYRAKKQRKRFLDDVLYQIDYLYQKKYIDKDVYSVERDAAERGITVSADDLVNDYAGISEFFKGIWLQTHFINSSGFARAKLRTILNRYNYKKRTERFCTYFDECVYFYKLDCTAKGSAFDIRTAPLDTMITFKALKRRRRRINQDSSIQTGIEK